MFLKVFKYDFNSIVRKMIPIFIILPILAIVVRLANLIPSEGNDIAVLIIVMLNAAFGFALVFLFVYTIVIVVTRYVKSLFKDQGYLTHTLPVSKHALLLSQLLVALIMAVISILLLVVCLLIAYFTGDLFANIEAILEEIFDYIVEPDFYSSIFLWLLSSIVASIQSILLLYLGIAIGHAHAKNKNILSVVYCIALSFGISLFLDMINLCFSKAILNYNSLLLVEMIEGIVVCLACYGLTIFTMKRRLNLE